MLLAVNGTLMRGLELNVNLLTAEGTFLEETRTAPAYRLYSIQDRYPGMIRANSGGASISLELWEVSPLGLIEILEKEPPGLCLGRILLADGRQVLGVLAEPYATEVQLDITAFGGWRAYISRATPPEPS